MTYPLVAKLAGPDGHRRSQAHMRFVDPEVTAHQLTGLARLAVKPSCSNLARLMGRTVIDSITHRSRTRTAR